jgi:Fur family transcriptional regulator, zinc uptake regulator
MVNTRIVMPFKELGHTHKACFESAISAAEIQCQERGVRLTPLRRRVLELIWGSHEPVKAYDLLDRIRDEAFSSSPPTVYRALDFLRAQGMVHRIESLNAYVGCAQPDNKHMSQFLICRNCGSVAEMDNEDVRNLLSKTAEQLGFYVDYEIIEINGMCATCASNI